MKNKSYNYSSVRFTVTLMRKYYYDAEDFRKNSYAKRGVDFAYVDSLIRHMTLVLERLYKLCDKHCEEHSLCMFSKGASLLREMKHISKAEKLVSFFEDILKKSVAKFSYDEKELLDDLNLVRRLYCEDVNAFNEFFGIKNDNPMLFLRVLCHVIPGHIRDDIEEPISRFIYRTKENIKSNNKKSPLTTSHVFMKPLKPSKAYSEQSASLPSLTV